MIKFNGWEITNNETKETATAVAKAHFPTTPIGGIVGGALLLIGGILIGVDSFKKGAKAMLKGEYDAEQKIGVIGEVKDGEWQLKQNIIDTKVSNEFIESTEEEAE